MFLWRRGDLPQRVRRLGSQEHPPLKVAALHICDNWHSIGFEMNRQEN